MSNLQREVWEGWTAQDFINDLEMVVDIVMSGESWYTKPFTTKKELIEYLVDNQPYYKKPIPEVNAYFAKKYGLK